MFGLSETLNWYSWFVGFYCISILLLPFLYKYFEKKNFNWFISIVAFYIIAVALHSIPNWDKIPIIHTLFTTCILIPLIIIGYMCGYWNKQKLIPNWFEGYNRIPLSFIVITAVMLINAFRYPTYGFCIQAFYTPFLIFAIVGIFNTIKIKWINSFLVKVGDLSMYMWFFHAIFFTESVNLYTKNLVFEPIHNYFYTLIMTFTLTYICSYIIKKLISPLTDKIR